MGAAAERLRLTTLRVRQLLMDPQSVESSLELPSSILGSELRCTELADLAVEVITAVDYLLTLLDSPTMPSQRLVLARDTGFHRASDAGEDDIHDRLTRRRLDARTAAVCLGTRLQGGLRRDAVND